MHDVQLYILECHLLIRVLQGMGMVIEGAHVCTAHMLHVHVAGVRMQGRAWCAVVLQRAGYDWRDIHLYAIQAGMLKCSTSFFASAAGV